MTERGLGGLPTRGWGMLPTEEFRAARRARTGEAFKALAHGRICEAIAIKSADRGSRGFVTGKSLDARSRPQPTSPFPSERDAIAARQNIWFERQARVDTFVAKMKEKNRQRKAMAKMNSEQKKAYREKLRIQKAMQKAQRAAQGTTSRERRPERTRSQGPGLEHRSGIFSFMNKTPDHVFGGNSARMNHLFGDGASKHHEPSTQTSPNSEQARRQAEWAKDVDPYVYAAFGPQANDYRNGVREPTGEGAQPSTNGNNEHEVFTQHTNGHQEPSTPDPQAYQYVYSTTDEGINLNGGSKQRSREARGGYDAAGTGQGEMFGQHQHQQQEIHVLTQNDQGVWGHWDRRDRNGQSQDEYDDYGR